MFGNSEGVLGLNNFTYSEADDIDLDDEDAGYIIGRDNHRLTRKKVDAEVKETEVKVTEVKVTEEERPEIEKVTGKIDYEAERKYFDIQSPEESVEAEKNCSSPMKKRQKLDSEAHTRQDIMNLEQEFNEIQFRHQASLNGLLQEWEYEKENLEGRKSS
ncbi:unnamed protein product [Mytilus edulis]|uniref:Uncharacterized protein n=1 Tax=Mytilus edulis TaxID=6550 RepID=A0A8S3U964_MYTED|nr:unnamed protein product [Mytilus edulis]